MRFMLSSSPSMNFPARCLLAVVSGLVYVLAFPPLDWGWLVIPGIAGLLLALRGQTGSRARAIGFLHGLAVYGAGVSWLYRIFGLPVVTLFFVLAVFCCLFAHFQSRAAAHGISGWKWAIFTAVNWGGLEFIRAEVFPLKFPWLTVGLAMGPNSLLPWIGVYGVGVLVVFGIVLVFTGKWKPAFAVFGLLAIANVHCRKLAEPDPGDPKSVRVAAIQQENTTIDDLLNASKALPQEVEYVAWPEYAISYDLRSNERDWAAVQEFCRSRKVTLTLGTQARPGNGEIWRNIALSLDETGELGAHTKVHTVHFFDDGVAGVASKPVETKFGPVGTPICFDCDYQDVIRGMTVAGAQWIVAPTMDAGSWTARQHEQHAELFRIRACENGRWILVAATSGVTQLIDANGKIHTRLPTMQQGSLVGSVKRESKLTFFSRIGWFLPWVVFAVAAAWWVIVLWKPKPCKPLKKLSLQK